MVEATIEIVVLSPLASIEFPDLPTNPIRVEMGDVLTTAVVVKDGAGEVVPTSEVVFSVAADATLDATITDGVLTIEALSAGASTITVTGAQ